MLKQNRNGDVLLNGEIQPPDLSKATLKAEGVYMLALGEVTGHSHVIEGDVRVWDVAGQTYVQVGEKGAQIRHEQHSPTGVEVVPGWYKQQPEVDFDPWEEMTRLVRD